jgi:Cu(I)-responsive transcriptional regulator
MDANTISIGDLSRATGTKVVTIRYYERIGILPEPPRTSGNYRAYGDSHMRRLRFIRRCRELGFTLEQVRELLSLSAEAEHDCSDVDRITAAHLATVEQKMADLEQLAGELRRLSKRCKGDRRVAECRIIEALSP